MTEAVFKYRSEAGEEEGKISLQDYERASKTNSRVSHLLNQKFSNADLKYGDAYTQALRSLGIFPKGDKKFGIPATTVGEMIDGSCMYHNPAAAEFGNTITSPGSPASGSATPATRLFFPEVILDLMYEKLIEDYSPEDQALNRMIAEDQTLNAPTYVRPMIDITDPRGDATRPMGQNALPNNMVSITASQVAYALNTVSIGLQISDQAMQYATLNLVSIIVAQQSEGERVRNLWRDISRITAGNPDAGESALTPVDFKATYDSSAAAGTITQLGWMKALYDPTRKLRYDSMLCTFDVLLDIYNRTGRPLMFDPKTTGVNTGDLGTYGPNVEPNVMNWDVMPPNVLIVPDGIFAAKHFVLIDSRYALTRVRNAAASYRAAEQMVLQRSNVMRFDYSEHMHRLWPDDQGSIKYVDYTND